MTPSPLIVVDYERRIAGPDQVFARIVKQTDFARRVDRACAPCANCPSRQSAAGQASSYFQKYCLTSSPNQKYYPPVPRSPGGALRDRHERGARDAMDA